MSKHLEKYKYSRPEYLKDFYIASDLVCKINSLTCIESKRSILVLLAGTSGTGKSTLASLLGSRLGISTVISTDTIRHVMRNFLTKEENGILFASTYETASFVIIIKD
jgi:2-phosphoglycerate kinase